MMGTAIVEFLIGVGRSLRGDCHIPCTSSNLGEGPQLSITDHSNPRFGAELRG
jgi:hypothetical protein